MIVAGVSVPAPVTLWRIGADTPRHTADDLSGAGARRYGGRWNRRGTPLLYASTSRGLACLETLAQLEANDLPLNRYLVAIEVPAAAWSARTLFKADNHVGWDAEPPGMVSITWGTRWARDRASLIAEVPSVIVPEEANLLINPEHADAASLRITKVRRWSYDTRLRLRETPLR